MVELHAPLHVRSARDHEVRAVVDRHVREPERVPPVLAERMLLVPRDVVFVRTLRAGTDYQTDTHARNVNLTATGLDRIERRLKCGSLHDDRNLTLCLDADTPVVTIVGKTWDLHVRDDLRIPFKANLEVIHDSVAFLKKRVDEVIFDAEHFFDGLAANPDYTLDCLRAAAGAGVSLICLCDTRGGSLPAQVAAGVDAARAATTVPLGIHCHNDCELAVANSVTGIEHGCVQVQGTINGFGERCGNANLVSVIPVLQLKRGYHCVSATQLKRLADVSHFIYELANVEPNKRQAFVGQSAFAHKGGLHVAAVQKNPETYEHIDPDLVGNSQRVLISDLSGRSNLLYKAEKFGIDLETNKPAVTALLQELKDLEARGFAFEGAEASFELLMQRALDGDRLQVWTEAEWRALPEADRPLEYTHAPGLGWVGAVAVACLN